MTTRKTPTKTRKINPARASVERDVRVMLVQVATLLKTAEEKLHNDYFDCTYWRTDSHIRDAQDNVALALHHLKTSE